MRGSVSFDGRARSRAESTDRMIFGRKDRSSVDVGPRGLFLARRRVYIECMGIMYGNCCASGD